MADYIKVNDQFDQPIDYNIWLRKSATAYTENGLMKVYSNGKKDFEGSSYVELLRRRTDGKLITPQIAGTNLTVEEKVIPRARRVQTPESNVQYELSLYKHMSNGDLKVVGVILYGSRGFEGATEYQISTYTRSPAYALGTATDYFFVDTPVWLRMGVIGSNGDVFIERSFDGISYAPVRVITGDFFQSAVNVSADKYFLRYTNDGPAGGVDTEYFKVTTTENDPNHHQTGVLRIAQPPQPTTAPMTLLGGGYGTYGFAAGYGGEAQNVGITTVDKTQSGQISIQKTVDKTQTGVLRVSKTTDRTQSGLLRVQQKTDRAQTGRIRIQGVLDRAQTGRLRVKTDTARTQTGVIRIEFVQDRTTTGVIRVSGEPSRTQQGTIRIQKDVSTTQTGRLRIVRIEDKDQTGRLNIIKRVEATQTGQLRIQAKSDRTQTGRLRVIRIEDREITGRIRISQSSNHDQTGVISIVATIAQSQTGVIAVYNEDIAAGNYVKTTDVKGEFTSEQIAQGLNYVPTTASASVMEAITVEDSGQYTRTQIEQGKF